MLMSASVRQLGFSGTSYKVTLSSRKSMSTSGPRTLMMVLLVSETRVARAALVIFCCCSVFVVAF